MRAIVLLICIWTLTFSTDLFAAKKNKVRSKRKQVPVEFKLDKKEPVSNPTKEQWWFLSSLGFHYWKGLGFFTEVGVGYLPNKEANWVPGFNNQLSLISGGSLFTSSVGGWYQSQALKQTQTGFLVGAFIGAAFPSRIQGESSTQIVPQLEAAWIKSVEEFASWRMIGRVSWISNRLSGQLSIGLIFDLN